MNLSLSKPVLFTVLTLSFVIFGSGVVAAQDGSGNTISGHVFGADRRPVSDIYVELLDDLGRSAAQSRTNPSGRYFFFRLPAGRFTIRVRPMGTDYEEQEQTVEIINFRRSSNSGDRMAGMTNEQRDFYLRPRRGIAPGAAGTVFVQDVPANARKLYEDALVDLDNKRQKEAWGGLKASIEAFPKYFAALELLGLEYARAGHYEAAQVLLLNAVDVNPRAYKSWHGLAVSLNALKKYDEALAAAEKSVEINPFAAESMLISGALLRQSKKYGEAEKRLAKAKELAGESLPDVHWQLALLYGNGLKRYKDAARELRSYLKARPDAKDADTIRKLIADFDEKAKTAS